MGGFRSRWRIHMEGDTQDRQAGSDGDAILHVGVTMAWNLQLYP